MTIEGAEARDKKPLFSIIVTTEHEEESLLALLEAIAQQAPPGCGYEMIVTDYSKTPRKDAVDRLAAEKHLPIRYHRLPGALPFEARNLGILVASGSIVVITDDDCIPFPTWLEGYKEAFDDLNLGVAGGPDKAPDHVRPFLKALDYVLTSFAGAAGMRGGGRAAKSNYYPRTWNMAISKEALDRAGLFDEHLPGAQEYDLVTRLHRLGYSSRYLPECGVWHRRDTDVRGHWRSCIRASLGRAFLWRMGSTSVRAAHVLPAAGLLTVSILLIALPHTRAAGGALAGVFGVYLAAIALSGIHAALSLKQAYMLAVVPGILTLQHLAHALGFLGGLCLGSIRRVLGAGSHA